MKVLVISLLLAFALSASADTFIDHTDGNYALVCSDDSGEWVCKPVPEELLRGFGWEDVEGIVPVIPHIKENTGNVIEPTECEC